MRANSELLLQMLSNTSKRVDMRTETNISRDCLSNLIDVNYDFILNSMFLLNSEKAVVYIIETLMY